MQTYQSRGTIPATTVIIGTDAAGKDHVANIVVQMIAEAGGVPVKRKHFLTGPATSETNSSDKSGLSLFAEKGFLLLYPLLANLLPWLMSVLLRRDLARFRQPSGNLVVVGHNCLRGLAFHYGHRHRASDGIRVPSSLAKTLSAMSGLPGLHPIVLDVDDDLRQARIASRSRFGKADHFDRYMAGDSLRSERIEEILVWLCRRYLDAQLIENNDLGEEELRALIVAGAAKRCA